MLSTLLAIGVTQRIDEWIMLTVVPGLTIYYFARAVLYVCASDKDER